MMATTSYTPQTSHLRDAGPVHHRHHHHHPAISTRPTSTDMHQPHLSAPASQESIVSVQSAASSVVPEFHASESNLSQITTYTDLTSPSSSQPGPKLAQLSSNMRRDITPENVVQTPHLNGEDFLASPMSITSPVATNGAKRTASGHVKNAPSLPNTPYTSTFPNRHSRRQSLSSSGSRAGELAATLKTRLGYAMAKVHHGWEHKSLYEVEQLAASRARNNRYSISCVDQQRPGSSGLSNGAARLSMYEEHSRGHQDVTALPPSKRHSANYGAYYSSPQYAPSTHDQAPQLQPPVDFRSTSAARPSATRPLSQQPKPYGTAMSPPRTPANITSRRPPTIRTETQTLEAERDALQALFQLGSPRTSQMPRSATATSSQASPSKAYLDTPRRVTFARSGSSSSVQHSSNSNASESREEQ